MSSCERQTEAADSAERRFNEIKQQLAILCRRSRSRIVPRSHERPCRWYPTEVRRPDSEYYFTDAGAWEFIADRIEAGDPVEEIVLDHPPGKSGFVMKIPGVDANLVIYVKLELGGGIVFGRSFHYSEKPEDE